MGGRFVSSQPGHSPPTELESDLVTVTPMPVAVRTERVSGGEVMEFATVEDARAAADAYAAEGHAIIRHNENMYVRDLWDATTGSDWPTPSYRRETESVRHGAHTLFNGASIPCDCPPVVYDPVTYRPASEGREAHATVSAHAATVLFREAVSVDWPVSGDATAARYGAVLPRGVTGHAAVSRAGLSLGAVEDGDYPVSGDATVDRYGAVGDAVSLWTLPGVTGVTR